MSRKKSISDAAASVARSAVTRTCVGCRSTDAAANMRRVVVDPAGRLTVQTGRRKLSGRGAYVHQREKCLIAAAARGGFDRSFRRKIISPDPAALLSFLSSEQPAASNEDQEYDS